MTWNDLVRIHFPKATNEFCDFVLYEKTPFPLSRNKDEIEEYIIELKNNK